MTGAAMPGGDFMAEGAPDQEQAVDAVSDLDKPESWYSVVWSSGKARVGLVILAIYILVALFAPLIAPYSPIDVRSRPRIPSAPTICVPTRRIAKSVGILGAGPRPLRRVRHQSITFEPVCEVDCGQAGARFAIR